MGQTAVLTEILNKVRKIRRLGYSGMARKPVMRPIKKKEAPESRRPTFVEAARGLEMRRIIDQED